VSITKPDGRPYRRGILSVAPVRAGTVRLGIFLSGELIPIVGEAAAVYLASSAINDAATYYNDNVDACSQ
jgi:hypothetical protein